MKKVLLYEYLSADGCVDEWVAPELRMQGRAMRDAVARDLARSGHIALTCVAGHDEVHEAADTSRAIEWRRRMGDRARDGRRAGRAVRSRRT
ncbi:hypothetical protein [Paraburkholderia hospita]|uniref:hypothetical protein n=1 Tax=Paraburkholderia hospita TaxID=169430 RepID=UPI001FC9DF2B|nr:hypothetical protein [Paraburkholderia hospita]